MAGVYTAAERVVRNGVLIAYEGEVMTGEEAEERGLIEAAEAGNPKEKTPKEKLIEHAGSLGIDVPKKATASDIEKLIAEAEAAAERKAE